jgi:NADPH:quinone reductase-like Zn-dependent oxidoreductase
MNDWFAEGAMAEYCVTQPAWIAPKPRGLTFAESAGAPIGALTAWQALFVRAKLTAGERVLVHGGAGSVGAFVIQLARLHGAEVVTTVSARNREFVTGLGAGEAIDYRTARFDEIVTGIDVVIDTVGGDTLERSWKVLKPGGRLVTIAAAGESARDERVKQAFFIVEPDAAQLSEVADLLESGRLKPGLDAVVPFAEAGDAFAGRFRGTQGRGKLVVAVSD